MSGQFDNQFINSLPGDAEGKNFRRQVRGACYSRVHPTPVPAPKLIAYSQEMVDELRLPVLPGDPEFTEVFAGNRLLEGMEPYAMCYGGHQFGNWAGQLGDGRAINLGEWVNESGRRWVLQLKGAGPTPYSRTADGLAVLRSSLREFLCSEAMHHLGIPTTRALSLVVTGREVVRDMFYDGRPAREPGAIVCRVAPTFTRFGNFEILASRGDDELLKQLIDYTIRVDYPHLDRLAEDATERWFSEICQRTAELMIHWMRVGFVHGVMNTDNMSILGQTIDYGPYGWLEGYDPGWTPNTTDADGRRYCYGNQPQIAMWNLVQLANALLTVVEDREALQAGIDLYAKEFAEGWRASLAAKLGWRSWNEDTDQELVEDLWSLLQMSETDMTIFFRKLADVPIPSLDRAAHTETAAQVVDSSSGEQSISEAEWEQLLNLLQPAYYDETALTGEHLQATRQWLTRYFARSLKEGRSQDQRAQGMCRVNPKYVPRNYLAQLAIDDAERGDAGKLKELFEVLRRPYDEQPEYEQYAARRPEWARNRAGCSMLSCSS